MRDVLDTERVLCAVDDLAENPCRGFRVGAGDWPLSGFLVRKGDRIRGYVNRCPHAGHPLNLKPDDFLTPDRSLIVCCSHGALFDIDSRLLHRRSLRRRVAGAGPARDRRRMGDAGRGRESGGL